MLRSKPILLLPSSNPLSHAGKAMFDLLSRRGLDRRGKLLARVMTRKILGWMCIFCSWRTLAVILADKLSPNNPKHVNLRIRPTSPTKGGIKLRRKGKNWKIRLASFRKNWIRWVPREILLSIVLRRTSTYWRGWKKIVFTISWRKTKWGEASELWKNKLW